MCHLQGYTIRINVGQQQSEQRRLEAGDLQRAPLLNNIFSFDIPEARAKLIMYIDNTIIMATYRWKKQVDGKSK